MYTGSRKCFNTCRHVILRYTCYTKHFEISFALLWNPMMITLVKSETNLEMYIEIARYSEQLYVYFVEIGKVFHPLRRWSSIFDETIFGTCPYHRIESRSSNWWSQTCEPLTKLQRVASRIYSWIMGIYSWKGNGLHPEASFLIITIMISMTLMHKNLKLLTSNVTFDGRFYLSVS